MWSRRDAAGARPVPLASVMAVQATAGPPHRSPIADSAQISPKVRCRVPTADGRQPPKTATRASRRLRATGSSKWTALHRTTHSRGSACQNLYKPLPRQPSRLAPAFLRAGRVDHHQAHILSAATTPVLPHRSARYVCCRRPRSPASHRTDPGWPSPPGAVRFPAGPWLPISEPEPPVLRAILVACKGTAERTYRRLPATGKYGNGAQAVGASCRAWCWRWLRVSWTGCMSGSRPVRPGIDEFRAAAASESAGDGPQIAASRVTAQTSAYVRGAQHDQTVPVRGRRPAGN